MVAMCRRLVSALLLVAVVGMLGPSPVTAQTDDTTPTTIGPEDAPGIIPEPNEGVEPQDPGDRGGALQTAVFLLIIGAAVTIGAFVVHQSRRARAERGF